MAFSASNGAIRNKNDRLQFYFILFFIFYFILNYFLFSIFRT